MEASQRCWIRIGVLQFLIICDSSFLFKDTNNERSHVPSTKTIRES